MAASVTAFGESSVLDVTLSLDTNAYSDGDVLAATQEIANAVRVPGGQVRVRITDTTSYLRGPSVLVAHGDVEDSWWAAQF